jgi:hypothetical protein
MLLSNLGQSRRLAETVASIPSNLQVDTALRLASLNPELAKQTKADADLIDNLARILKSQNPQARRLRKLLREVARG